MGVVHCYIYRTVSTIKGAVSGGLLELVETRKVVGKKLLKFERII